MSDVAPTSSVDPDARPAGAPVPHEATAAAPALAAPPGAALPRAAGATRRDLPAVITDAARRRFTGLVRVGDDGELWFDEGRLYLATSAGSPSLFDVLFGADVGASEALEAVCADADAGGQPVVERLVEQEAATGPRLRRVLHEHNLAALFELSVPSDDPLEVEAGARHVIGTRFAEPAEDLLASATRRIELWRRIAVSIPSTSLRFRLAPGLPDGEDRTVTADEWTFLALLDGHRSVADVITGTGESAFRVCSVLYRMLLEGLIEPA